MSHVSEKTRHMLEKVGCKGNNGAQIKTLRSLNWKHFETKFKDCCEESNKLVSYNGAEV